MLSGEMQSDVCILCCLRPLTYDLWMLHPPHSTVVAKGRGEGRTGMDEGAGKVSECGK